MKSQFEEALKQVHYKGWSFLVREDGGTHVMHPPRYYLQIAFNAPNRDDGRNAAWTGRKWWLSRHMTQSEIVQTALMAVLAAEEHEARENFTYRGEPIFCPHYDVDELHRLFRSSKKDVRL